MPGRAHDGWIVHESGPADAEHAVLLLPGGLCTAAFYDELLAELPGSGLRFVATTLPGFGATPPLADLTFENYARGAAKLAADLGCDAVVGHSLGANVAIEMAAGAGFAGPLVLLAPSFSREDEFKELSVLDRIGRVPGLGPLAWAAMMKTMDRAMKDDLHVDRHDALVAEMKQASPGFCRRNVRQYFAYLDKHGSVAPRLCASGARAWVVFGDGDAVGLTDAERGALDDCPTVTRVTIEGVGHFTLNETPGRVAEIVREAVRAA